MRESRESSEGEEREDKRLKHQMEKGGIFGEDQELSID